MADVMGRGHDGDGREDPPHPGGRGAGQHEMDVVPPRKRRGKARNLKLIPTWEANGKKPLPLRFDDYTATTVGDIHDLFIREVGIIISRDISLDRPAWNKVTPAERNALFEHLRPYFDIDGVMEDPDRVRLSSGLETMLANSYKSRKNHAKKHFVKVGGYEHIEEVKENPPPGMSVDKWHDAVGFFTSEKHLKDSARNKNNRALQVTKNRGGTASYSNWAFKKGKSRLDVYHDAHTNKDGIFVDPVDEANYQALAREVVAETQLVASSNNPTPVNEPAIFEKVLGKRRGRVKGVGPIPSMAGTSCHHNEHPRASQEASQETQVVNAIVNHPTLRETVTNLFRSLSTQNTENDSGNAEQNDLGNDNEDAD